MQYSWEARYGKEESSRVLGLQFCTLSRCRLPLQLWTADAKFRHLIGEPKPRYLKDDPNQIGAPSSSGTHAVHADLAVSVSILLSVISLFACKRFAAVHCSTDTAARTSAAFGYLISDQPRLPLRACSATPSITSKHRRLRTDLAVAACSSWRGCCVHRAGCCPRIKVRRRI